MPKRKDIKKILIIGSGPIVIGQGCEFDYSGTQACRALREEGYEVVLVNSNPATIMTDPEIADKTYIEPITPTFVEKIIRRERPDAVLPTLGGQTGLNTAVVLAQNGVFKKYGVEMIGANLASIKKAEERELFKQAMKRIDLEVPRSAIAHTVAQAKQIAKRIGYPVAIRPGFTLGGSGGGFADDPDELEKIVSHGLDLSLNNEVLIEENLSGWKEFEMEVMRDKNDNVVIVCSIENLDPMGVHTGDSITVAPIQTLSDQEYQRMRDASIKVIREIGVETGGSNIQFATDPKSDRMVVIEMNPRVSRSSALASKATGFPIAKIAAKLAVGYTLDELRNDITKKTPASFEPTLDYCVVKIPRFAFEKFPDANPQLGTQMKAVGETMAIGRNFKEALQKGLRGLEIGTDGLVSPPSEYGARQHLETPHAERIFLIADAIRSGMSIKKLHVRTKVDPWFLDQMLQIVETERDLIRQQKKFVAKKTTLLKQTSAEIRNQIVQAKKCGFSDSQLAKIFKITQTQFRSWRKRHNINPTYHLIDTCAGEFEAYTPYYYSSYENESEVRPSPKKKILIIGGGPNRIGQGIEFDYCCCHAAFALDEIGFETIMVNSNPETVSTDYDTSDRLYFEPVTLEDVLNIVEVEKPHGVIVQFGGQTPLNLASRLKAAGVPIIGTQPKAIEASEDRRQFKRLLNKLKLQAPRSASVHQFAAIKKRAAQIGYPVLLRPSFVLGGRAMEIVYDEKQLIDYLGRTSYLISPEKPLLVDHFLEDATELDVDLITDGKTTVIGGIMQHIEEAGIHSGDSACYLPHVDLDDNILSEVRRQAIALAQELNVIGLMNIQFAVKGSEIFILEVNPRASRTVPFVSKSIGVPLAKLAAKVMAGKKLRALGFTNEITPHYYSVKEAVLPFVKFSGIDIILGPEMKSTGEVMGIDQNPNAAYAKALLAAGVNLPLSGTAFLSVKDSDKASLVPIAQTLAREGFTLVATAGTADYLEQHGDVKISRLKKLQEGHPNASDLLTQRKLNLVINTPSGAIPRKDEVTLRSMAVTAGIAYTTTITAAYATAKAIESLQKNNLKVAPLQQYHSRIDENTLQR